MNGRHNRHAARFIKSELILAGVTQMDISRKSGIHPVSINDVISGKRRTQHVREAIASAINKDVSYLWPEQPEEENEVN